MNSRSANNEWNSSHEPPKKKPCPSDGKHGIKLAVVQQYRPDRCGASPKCSTSCTPAAYSRQALRPRREMSYS
jgi:hypothetical protein